MADNSTAPSIKWWFNSSVVAHAVSRQPGSGYIFQDVILPPRGPQYFDGTTTHNPTVLQLSDGTFAIYYIGLNCHNYTNQDCIKHQWIGAAHASSLDGPWTRLAQPVLAGLDSGIHAWEGGMVANPAVVARSDGSLLMAYRGLDDRGIGMAASHSWGGPFERLHKGAPVLGPDSVAKTAVDEDLTMWSSHRPGTLQMILHQEGVGNCTHLGNCNSVGAHAVSTDEGMTWKVVGTAYTLTVAGVDTYLRRERPQMLKDGPNGLPTYMFNGVVDTDGFSHTIATPLRTDD